MDSVYNPLDKKNLGISVRDALLSQPVNPMPPGRFRGAGIYAIYYTGSFKAYLPVSEQNRGEKFACPIYVGKAVPGSPELLATYPGGIGGNCEPNQTPFRLDSGRPQSEA